ncbi:sensor histidine kinase [Pedobacter heparinus]|uniref:sensor histidine kinase n=1 Tax=Pedobacter heparinus TaxID=984 RepID=UPI00292E7075|nr:histidine kinase [Pedobacter heparinus]
MKTVLAGYFNFLNKYRIHFIAWFFFIFYEVIISGILRGYFATVGNYVLFYAFNICLFYFHAYVIMPAAKSNTKHGIWLLPLLIVLEVIVFVPFSIVAAGLFHKYIGLILVSPATLNKTSIVTSVWRTIYFILFSSGYYYLVNYLRERKITQEAEKEKLLMIIENQNVQAELIKSQYARLKAQINPHFLFNTLSFIYASARKTAPEAAEAIITLSDMMRYSIQDDEEQIFTDLILEIEQVENLIKLHQIKSEREPNIILEYDPDLSETQIIPLILITLVENVFKHGDLFQETQPALVSINMAQNILIIETRNLINVNGSVLSHNIGLDNIKKRLTMVYGDKAFLQTSKDRDNYFNVLLTIDLN